MFETITISTDGTSEANFVTNLSSNNSNLFVNMLGTYETVLLGNGNDAVQIQLGAGNDIVNLGSGFDSVSITGSTSTTSNDTINLGTGVDNVNATGDVNVSVTGLTNLQASINLQASTGFDSISLGNGNSYINLGNNAGSIDAGNGNNTINIGDSTSPVSITLGDGQNSVNMGSGIIDVVTMGNGNNNQVTAGNEQIGLITMGNGNNDSVTMGTGQDFVYMGNGNNAHVTLGDGNNTVIMGSGVCNLVQLGNGSNYVDAGAGQDVVIAGNGGTLGNMFIYEAQSHGVVSTGSTGWLNPGGSNCGSGPCGGNLQNSWGNQQGGCGSSNIACGNSQGNACGNTQQVSSNCYDSTCSGNFNNTCDGNANCNGNIQQNNCFDNDAGCGGNICSQNICTVSMLCGMEYSYYSATGHLNTLEINMTHAQYQSYLALDSHNFTSSIPAEYTFASIPLIINNMTNIVFNDINAPVNTDTLHFLSAPSGQVYTGSETTNILDYSGIVPSTPNIHNEVLHVDLVAGQTSLTNTSDVQVGYADTVQNFNSVIGAENDLANIIKISSLLTNVDGGLNQPVQDTALNGLVANTLVSNNELDLSGISGNINISSTGTATHGTWTDIGIINLGSNTTLNLDAPGVTALQQHNVQTIVINTSSVLTGANDSVIANDTGWTELSHTVNGVDPTGGLHTYNVFTHGNETVLIDHNIHVLHLV